MAKATLTRTLPPMPQTERGSFCFISTDAPGERLIYTHATDVLWRPIAGLVQGGEKPEDVFCWRQHTRKVSCASMSPNSNWMVSGDVEGKIKIWGTRGDNVQKNEFRLWDGVVKEVHFSADSTRIVAAGDGKEVRAVAMIMDTGSKTGEIGGHAKQVNSISFKPTRPFRVVTGAEDSCVNFHEGPPFKFTKSQQEHSNFVNCVRYSPDGNWVVSAGSDSKLILYEGKAGELQGEFEKPAGITGSLFSAEWSPDNARVATAGGDRKLRIWDRETRKQLVEVKIGTGALEDMQIGLTWAGASRVITICLDARLLVWDLAADGTPTLAATVEGTQGPLATLALDASSGILLRGGFDGQVVMERPDGKTQKARVGKMINRILAHSSASSAAEAFVFSQDESVRRLSLDDGQLGEPIALEGIAIGAAWLDPEETRVIVCTSKRALVCVGPGGIEWRKEGACPRDPTSMDCLPGRGIAVGIEKPDGATGGVENRNFDIVWFDIAGLDSADGIAIGKTMSHHTKEVSSIKFAPTGDLMASADSNGQIALWDLSSCEVVQTFCLHTARVNDLDWLPGTRRLVSGSLDGHVFVWDADAPKDKVKITEAHKGGTTGVVGCGDKSFATVGQDGFTSVWSL